MATVSRRRSSRRAGAARPCLSAGHGYRSAPASAARVGWVTALRYDVVDVFTDRPYAGNPLAVVHGADDLSDAQMLAIAAEFNLSETTFPLPPAQDGADYRVRIFTPAVELPFAGHPSVGAAWVLARDGVIAHGERLQECGAGLLPVRVDADGARISGGTPTVGGDADAGALAAAVGLTPDDVDGAAAPGFAGAGVRVRVPARAPDAVARAVPDAAAIRALTPGLTGLVVGAVDADATACTCGCSRRARASTRTRRPGRPRWRSACSSPTGDWCRPTASTGSRSPRGWRWVGRRRCTRP